jgi:glutathione S-transferase
MDAAEDMRQRIGATLRLEDPAAKRAARQALAGDDLPRWGASVERQIGAGPFVAGGGPSVADIKLHMIDRWISSGALDDIPAGTLDAFPRLKALSGAVRSHPAVIAWYAKG